MRRVILTAALGICATMTAAEPKKIFPYPYDQHDFANGLRLITVKTDYPNVVALYIVVNVGSRNEVEPGKSGFAHFFEHMMFRGTKKNPPAKWEATMKAAGADTNAFTSDDLTAYHAVFPKAGLESILELEADRFQNLEYAEDAFRTEALAVNGEYNKNSAAPTQKLFEKLRETAFDKHTYRHTTMGFLEDIKKMPEQYAYSKTFFDRFYRPEYTTVLVVGDVDHAAVKPMVEKYWGGWKRGNYVAEIPREPEQAGERKAHVDWPVATAPWVMLGYKMPAYTDEGKETAALDLIAALGFGPTSAAYQKLVLKDQTADALMASAANHVDPYLFVVASRVKKEADMEAVRETMLSTLAQYEDTLVDKRALDLVKKHLRYRLALHMDNSAAVAGTLAYALALRRTPETLNRLYAVYESITPEDIRAVARKVFEEKGRTVVTLTGPKAK
jgi:zinc protease